MSDEKPKRELTQKEREDLACAGDDHWKKTQHMRLFPHVYTTKELKALGLSAYPDQDDRPRWAK
jgi:hypothetical protein